MTAIQETIEQQNRRAMVEQIIDGHKRADAARQARLPATPAERKQALEVIDAQVRRDLAEDRGAALRRIERTIGDRRAELRRGREARIENEQRLAAIREAALIELADIIIVPPGGDVGGLAFEAIGRAATGGSAEWLEEIGVAREILEVGGHRALAGWVAYQLASAKPLWA